MLKRALGNMPKNPDFEGMGTEAAEMIQDIARAMGRDLRLDP
jgi:hypothetical protein